VEECPARSIDGARVIAVQRQNVPRLAGQIIQIGVRQSFPSTADADDVASDFPAAVHHRLDDGVQTGNVAASSEYAYAFLGHV
jgi:hypothetical protein